MLILVLHLVIDHMITLQHLNQKNTKEELIIALKIKSETVADCDYFNKILAMYMGLNLSFFLFNLSSVRKNEKLKKYNDNIHGCKLYSAYKVIAETKTCCYLDHIEVSSSGAKIILYLYSIIL